MSKLQYAALFAPRREFNLHIPKQYTMFVTKSKNGFTVKAYQGDAKTQLAFNLSKSGCRQLAGFTIECKPGNKASFYLFNELSLANVANSVQVKSQPGKSSINSPLQKFRWLHVPGGYDQHDGVFYGKYTYTVTPRYFDKDNDLTAIDPSLSVSVTIKVQPFVKGNVKLGFTRGLVQSQAFVDHFGPKAVLHPASFNLYFNTSMKAGRGGDGKPYTYLDEYEWSGFTAREQIFSFINNVLANKSLGIDVFAYDFNEPDIIQLFLKLAKEGRIRMILDNASLHHSVKSRKPEDKFAAAFQKIAPAMMKRGKFGRFQHNKVFIATKKGKAQSVLAGSTNFSVTGMYVNANHVVVFNNPDIAAAYEDSFEEAWNDGVSESKFVASFPANKIFTFGNTNVTFSPHKDAFAKKRLQSIANRVKQEKSSVLFAIMDTDPNVSGPITPAIKALHNNKKIFSAGITDSDTGISLYRPDKLGGIEVTGKPGETLLPPPFDKEPSIGMDHEVHHKFIVCGFNKPDAVVWFGSSNLSEGGEDNNGDNLIEVHDRDIATVFAIEALSLVDHYMFLDDCSDDKTGAQKTLNLCSDYSWTAKYYDKANINYKERMMF